MKKLEVLNYPIYSFVADQNLVNEVLEDVKHKKFHVINTEGSNMSMYHDYYHEKLFNFFDDSIKTLCQLYYKDEIKFPITDCWVNKYHMMQRLRNHTHSNSYISGLFYLTSHENSGATVFNIPDPWSGIDAAQDETGIPHQHLSVYKKQQYLSSEVYPTAGTLLLFPSQVAHYTKSTNAPSEVRYTISFNCFPSGPVSLGQTSLLVLNTLSLKDRIELGKQNNNLSPN